MAQVSQSVSAAGSGMAGAGASLAWREEVQKLEKEHDVHVDKIKELSGRRSGLTLQLNENTLVSQELERLEAGTEVFKAMGPALVKTDLDEAKTQVTARLAKIRSEINKIDELVSEHTKKRDAIRAEAHRIQNEQIQNLQKELYIQQQQQAQAQMKAQQQQQGQQQPQKSKQAS